MVMKVCSPASKASAVALYLPDSSHTFEVIGQGSEDRSGDAAQPGAGRAGPPMSGGLAYRLRAPVVWVWAAIGRNREKWIPQTAA